MKDETFLKKRPEDVGRSRKTPRPGTGEWVAYLRRINDAERNLGYAHRLERS